MSRSALQLVETVPFYRRELTDSELSEGDDHSLHYSIALMEGCPAKIAQYCIERFSKKGEVVLDPFCGAGATPLEAALRGRVPYASDTNPYFVRVAEAKCAPSDLTEVTLTLQSLNVRKPIDIKVFSNFFSPFYDINTFRELVNLREFLHTQPSPVTRFIELTASGLLHGPSAGFFSAYSFPQISLRPELQKELNRKRNQVPDYRAIVPRILRRTASVLRDGLPSVMRSNVERGRFAVSDSRNLSYIGRPGVGLVLTAPPLPAEPNHVEDLWLRMWFSGIQGVVPARGPAHATVESWLDFMNEALCEWARVVARGGRVALILRSVKVGAQDVDLDQLLKDYVEENLRQFWEAEGSFVAQEKSAQLKECLGERDPKKLRQRNRVLVLRRK
ncbi:MAG: hypothetical protein K1X79_02170 [Oligoflexia bacterium]|nr:hypothetical protein [Oligoflexia bacterium]